MTTRKGGAIHDAYRAPFFMNRRLKELGTNLFTVRWEEKCDEMIFGSRKMCIFGGEKTLPDSECIVSCQYLCQETTLYETWNNVKSKGSAGKDIGELLNGMRKGANDPSTIRIAK